jgi:hypothetical protein
MLVSNTGKGRLLLVLCLGLLHLAQSSPSYCRQHRGGQEKLRRVSYALLPAPRLALQAAPALDALP